jgi:cytosine/adenosine deaminase-related metal-dependent hydrolase
MTYQGQKSAGWNQCGSIEAGYLADFIVVDTMSPRTAGASLDGIPLVAAGADVTDVFVNGNRVVNQRQHKDGDPTQAIAGITALLRGKETL